MFLLPYEIDLFPEMFKEEEKLEEYKLKVKDADDE